MPLGSWFQQQLANVAGTAEPIHGPTAIQTVTKQAETTPYTELTKEDQKWRIVDGTNVETKTFYMFADSGVLGSVQIIYSNVGGIRITSQFNTKIFNHVDGAEKNLWSSDPLDHFHVGKDKCSATAKDMSITLSEDGNSYAIKSSTNKKSIVDLTFTREAEGFVVGKDGTSYFGTDPKKPWGSMMHSFWPRCRVDGSVMTKTGPVDFKGKGIYIHALQGMKPHHLASRWNFLTFQSPTYSAVLMGFTTPPSYGNTPVTVGGLTSTSTPAGAAPEASPAGKSHLLFANATPTATHTAHKPDTQNDWPEPTTAKYTWTGVTKEGKQASAVLEGALGERLDRVDVMAEVPGFVKQIVAAAAGTKPYVYQYGPKMTLKVTIDGQTTEEEGQVLTEATFIS